MNQEEYKSSLEIEHHKLIYLIKRNSQIALLGLGVTGAILLYDTTRIRNTVGQLIKDPAVNELYLSKEKPEIKRKEELKTIIENLKLERSKNVEKAAIGIGGASALYFIGGLTIPLVSYRRKRKFLENELD